MVRKKNDFIFLCIENIYKYMEIFSLQIILSLSN